MTDGLKPVAWVSRWKIDGEWGKWRVSAMDLSHIISEDYESKPLYVTDQTSAIATDNENKMLIGVIVAAGNALDHFVGGKFHATNCGFHRGYDCNCSKDEDFRAASAAVTKIKKVLAR